MEIDGPSQTVTLITGGKIALVLFDGVAGQLLNIGITGTFSPCNGNVTVFNPDGTTLTSNSCAASISSSTDMDLQLPMAGEYTILIDGDGASTGSMTFTLSTPVDAGEIFIDGASVAVDITRPGQDGRLQFNFGGAVPQSLNIGMSGVTFTSCNGNVTIFNPDGTTLISSNCVSSGGADFDVELPMNGTYTILVDGNGASTGSMTFTLTSS